MESSYSIQRQSTERGLRPTTTKGTLLHILKLFWCRKTSLHTQEKHLAGKCSPAGHSIHMKSQEICKEFSSLWPGRVTPPPPPSQKRSPGTRNLERSERSSSNNTSHLGQKKSLQLQWKAQLFPNQQSCDREETRRAAGKTPSPYTGSQGHSITLPYPQPLLSSDHANTVVLTGLSHLAGALSASISSSLA